MINPFEKMIDDCFKVPEFVQTMLVNGTISVPCICYQTAIDELYSEYGQADGVNFYLTAKTADYEPQKNDRITYRNTTYKVDSYTVDSFHLTSKINLKSINTR